jgi:hypothetical protein
MTLQPPILTNKAYDDAPVFTAANLLREARRQKGLPLFTAPRRCLLDPDGDIVRALVGQGRAERAPDWACYHTQLFITELDGEPLGLIGCVVGAAFAVLVAEELFASGCERGIEEGNGTAPDDALWLTYSVNKEDIWVSRVPVPVRATVDEHGHDDFRTILPGGVVPKWNLYSPRWASIQVEHAGAQAFLRLRDADPYDYAKAVRVFPESQHLTLRFTVRLHQAGQDEVAIDVVDRQGRRPIRLVLAGAAGEVQANAGTQMRPVAPLVQGQWHNVIVLVDCAQQRYDLAVEGQLIAVQAPFVEAVDAVERLEFRTGSYRREDRQRLPCPGAYLTDDLPGADEPVAETICDIADVATIANH